VTAARGVLLWDFDGTLAHSRWPTTVGDPARAGWIGLSPSW
jgi:hypothetical protein